MSLSPKALVEKKVQAARARIAFREAAFGVLLGVAIGMGLVALWFLVRPLVSRHVIVLDRWVVGGVLLGVSVVACVVRRLLLVPNVATAALAVDHEFELRERVTTLLGASDDQLATAPGRALVRDAEIAVSQVRVGAKFPLTVPAKQWLAPVVASLIAVGCYFLEPLLANLRSPVEQQREARAINVKQVEDQLENLKKISLTAKNPNQPKSEELEKLEAEWNKLINKPLDLKSEEKIRERVNEMKSLEARMRERTEQLKDKVGKADTLKSLLKKLGEMGAKNDRREGAVKEFEDALAKGDFQKAKEMMDKLAKELGKNSLSKEQMKDLAKDLQDLKEKLKKISRDDERVKKLKKALEEGLLDKEQVAEELKKFEDLEELAQMIGECQECIGKGDSNGARAAMGRMAGKFGEMDLSEDEFRRLMDEMDALARAAQGIGEGMEEGNGMGEGDRPGGVRPIDPNDPDSKVSNERQKGTSDPNGQQVFAGFSRGGQFTRIPSKQVDGAFRQAVQDSSDALDRQRLPDDAKDIVQGYFDRFRGSK